MTKDEKRVILSEHLAKFRTWSYAELAARIDIDGGHLEHVEGVAPGGTNYQMEVNVFWDDKRFGDVRIIGDISENPQKPLLGFIPIYFSDVTDSLIMSPDGRFVGEDATNQS